jgi:LPXTG-site transpeptidase (sortase) family protein
VTSLVDGIPHRAAVRSRLGWCLIALGLAALAICTTAMLRVVIYQRSAQTEIDRMIAEAPRESPTIHRTAPDAVKLPRGSLIGRVEVPRLNLSAAIAEGDDDSTLEKAAGHLPDTVLPWEPAGNAAIAAHRDGLFRPLRHIQINDEVIVATPRGEFLYRVKKTEVVNPEDVGVLAPTNAPTLTLITCYPFSFVGHAPQRFVVQAERVVPELTGTPLRGSAAR